MFREKETLLVYYRSQLKMRWRNRKRLLWRHFDVTQCTTQQESGNEQKLLKSHSFPVLPCPLLFSTCLLSTENHKRRQKVYSFHYYLLLSTSIKLGTGFLIPSFLCRIKKGRATILVNEQTQDLILPATTY